MLGRSWLSQYEIYIINIQHNIIYYEIVQYIIISYNIIYDISNLSAGAGGAGKILVVSMELGGHCAGTFLIPHFPFFNHYRITIALISEFRGHPNIKVISKLVQIRNTHKQRRGALSTCPRNRIKMTLGWCHHHFS